MKILQIHGDYSVDGDDDDDDDNDDDMLPST
jgi:hypothetical protein